MSCAVSRCIVALSGFVMVVCQIVLMLLKFSGKKWKYNTLTEELIFSVF